MVVYNLAILLLIWVYLDGYVIWLLTFLNLMSANGVMAKTIIRNYKQKQEREVKKNDYISQAKKIFI